MRSARTFLGNAVGCGAGCGVLCTALSAWGQPTPAAGGDALQAAPQRIPVPSALSEPVGVDLTLWWEAPLELTLPHLGQDARQVPFGVPMVFRQTLWQSGERLALDYSYERAEQRPSFCFSAYCDGVTTTTQLELFWRALDVPLPAFRATLAMGLGATVGAQSSPYGTASFATLGPRLAFLPFPRRSRAHGDGQAPESLVRPLAVGTAAAGAVLLGRVLSTAF